jgi:hypothetical protein
MCAFSLFKRLHGATIARWREKILSAQLSQRVNALLRVSYSSGLFVLINLDYINNYIFAVSSLAKSKQWDFRSLCCSAFGFTCSTLIALRQCIHVRRVFINVILFYDNDTCWIGRAIIHNNMSTSSRGTWAYPLYSVLSGDLMTFAVHSGAVKCRVTHHNVISCTIMWQQ